MPWEAMCCPMYHDAFQSALLWVYISDPSAATLQSVVWAVSRT